MRDRLHEVDEMLRDWGVPLRLAIRVRSYLAFVLRRQVSREQAELVNGEGGGRGGRRRIDSDQREWGSFAHVV